MPLVPPNLDNRTFNELVTEAQRDFDLRFL